MKDDAALRKLTCWLLTGSVFVLPLIPDTVGCLAFPEVQWILCGALLIIMLAVRWLPSFAAWELRVVYLPFTALIAGFAGYMLVRAGLSPAFPASLVELMIGGAVIVFFLVTLDCVDRRRQAERLVYACLFGVSLRILVRLLLLLFGTPALYAPLPCTAGILLLPGMLMKRRWFSVPLACEIALSGRWPVAVVSGVLVWLARRRRLQESTPEGFPLNRKKLLRTASLMLLLAGITAMAGNVGGGTQRSAVPAAGEELPIHHYRGIVRSVIASSPWIGVGQGALETVTPLFAANYLSRPRLEGWKRAPLPSRWKLPWILGFVAEQGMLGLGVVVLLAGAFFRAAWRQYRYTYDPIYRNLQLVSLTGIIAACLLAGVSADHFRVPGLLVVIILAAANLSIGKIDLFAVGNVVFTFQRPFKGIRLAAAVALSVGVLLSAAIGLYRFSSAYCLAEHGKTLLAAGNSSEALVRLQKAETAFSSVRDLSGLLGRAYLREGKTDKAAAQLERALAVVPNRVNYLAAAECALENGRATAARTYVETAGFFGATGEETDHLLKRLEQLEQ